MIPFKTYPTLFAPLAVKACPHSIRFPPRLLTPFLIDETCSLPIDFLSLFPTCVSLFENAVGEIPSADSALISTDSLNLHAEVCRY